MNAEASNSDSSAVTVAAEVQLGRNDSDLSLATYFEETEAGDDSHGNAEKGWRSCICIFAVFLLILSCLYAVFIFPFSIPYLLENRVSCSEILPDAGINVGNNLESYTVKEYYSLTDFGDSTLEDIEYEAVLRKGDDTVVGSIKVDKDFFYSDLCSDNGVCIVTPLEYTINQVPLFEPLYVFSFNIVAPGKVVVKGEVSLERKGSLSAEKYKPTMSLLLNESLLIFASKGSVSYRQRINFNHGRLQGTNKTTLWPGASLSVFYQSNADARYCVPQVSHHEPINISQFITQATSDFEVMEMILQQGETLAQLQFLIRLANVVSQEGNIAKNRFILYITILSLIVLSCCLALCNWSKITTFSDEPY
mmetsp:Transcript_18030/g.23550  ORF Transcript_18030/g.23550 Transcript_18030/m.23550 type:complete len:364 (+) Transcript_18030:178-1269(+)